MWGEVPTAYFAKKHLCPLTLLFYLPTTRQNEEFFLTYSSMFNGTNGIYFIIPIPVHIAFSIILFMSLFIPTFIVRKNVNTFLTN